PKVEHRGIIGSDREVEKVRVDRHAGLRKGENRFLRVTAYLTAQPERGIIPAKLIVRDVQADSVARHEQRRVGAGVHQERDAAFYSQPRKEKPPLDVRAAGDSLEAPGEHPPKGSSSGVLGRCTGR